MKEGGGGQEIEAEGYEMGDGIERGIVSFAGVFCLFLWNLSVP